MLSRSLSHIGLNALALRVGMQYMNATFHCFQLDLVLSQAPPQSPAETSGTLNEVN